MKLKFKPYNQIYSPLIFENNVFLYLLKKDMTMVYNAKNAYFEISNFCKEPSVGEPDSRLSGFFSSEKRHN